MQRNEVVVLPPDLLLFATNLSMTKLSIRHLTMQSEYLKYWASLQSELWQQKLINLLVRSRVGLNHRHEYHLFRHLARIPSGKKIKVLEIGPGSGWFLSYQRPGLTTVR